MKSISSLSKAMWIANSLIAAMLNFALFGAVPCLAQETPSEPPGKDWKTLEEQYAALTEEPLCIERALNVPALRDIYEMRDPSIYWEMVHQVDCRGIQLIGFQFLVEGKFESAVDAGAHIVLSKKSAGYLTLMVLEKMSDSQYADHIVQQLPFYASAYPENYEAWCQMLAIVPKEKLRAAFDARQLDEMPATCKALVLDFILEDTSLQDRQKYVAELAAYRHIPGTPRAIYAFHMTDQDVDLVSIIPEVLNDQMVSEPTKIVVAYKYRVFIKEHIDWESMNLSNRIRQVIGNDDPTAWDGLPEN